MHLHPGSFAVISSRNSSRSFSSLSVCCSKVLDWWLREVMRNEWVTWFCPRRFGFQIRSSNRKNLESNLITSNKTFRSWTCDSSASLNFLESSIFFFSNSLIKSFKFCNSPWTDSLALLISVSSFLISLFSLLSFLLVFSWCFHSASTLAGSYKRYER